MYNSLEIQFRNLAIERGGILFFNPKNALMFTQASRDKGYKLLGIDGFFLTDNTTQPSMENSISFSDNLEDIDKKYRRAIEFIEKYQNKNIYFEIIYEE